MQAIANGGLPNVGADIEVKPTPNGVGDCLNPPGRVGYVLPKSRALPRRAWVRNEYQRGRPAALPIIPNGTLGEAPAFSKLGHKVLLASWVVGELQSWRRPTPVCRRNAARGAHHDPLGEGTGDAEVGAAGSPPLQARSQSRWCPGSCGRPGQDLRGQTVRLVPSERQQAHVIAVGVGGHEALVAHEYDAVVLRAESISPASLATAPRRYNCACATWGRRSSRRGSARLRPPPPPPDPRPPAAGGSGPNATGAADQRLVFRDPRWRYMGPVRRRTSKLSRAACYGAPGIRIRSRISLGRRKSWCLPA